MRLEPGDIVLVPFPFTDLSATKTRPAIVLSTAACNARGLDVIACALSSRAAATAHSVLVQPHDVVGGRLRTASRVLADKVVTLEKRLIGHRVGRLRRPVLDRVLKEFFRLFPRPA